MAPAAVKGIAKTPVRTPSGMKTVEGSKKPCVCGQSFDSYSALEAHKAKCTTLHPPEPVAAPAPVAQRGGPPPPPSGGVKKAAEPAGEAMKRGGPPPPTGAGPAKPVATGPPAPKPAPPPAAKPAAAGKLCGMCGESFPSYSALETHKNKCSGAEANAAKATWGGVPVAPAPTPTPAATPAAPIARGGPPPPPGGGIKKPVEAAAVEVPKKSVNTYAPPPPKPAVASSTGGKLCPMCGQSFGTYSLLESHKAKCGKEGEATTAPAQTYGAPPPPSGAYGGKPQSAVSTKGLETMSFSGSFPPLPPTARNPGKNPEIDDLLDTLKVVTGKLVK